VGSLRASAQAVKEALRIPVLANGNVETMADALACLNATRCDGVMSAEGLRANPALFAPLVGGEGGGDFGSEAYEEHRLDMAREYLRFAARYEVRECDSGFERPRPPLLMAAADANALDRCASALHAAFRHRQAVCNWPPEAARR
jgi:tRNA-dihydrouridine synthase